MTALQQFIAVSSALTGTDLYNCIPQSHLETLAEHFLSVVRNFDPVGADKLLSTCSESSDFSSVPTTVEKLIVALWYTGIASKNAPDTSDESTLATAALSFRNALLWQVYGSTAKAVPKQFEQT